MRPSLLTILPLLALIGCGPTIDARLDDYPDFTRLIERFYTVRAFEHSGTCIVPRMTLTDAVVVSETADQLVVDVRYAFDAQGGGSAGSGLLHGSVCRGFGERRFTLGRADGQLRVLAMTGEQRR